MGSASAGLWVRLSWQSASAEVDGGLDQDEGCFGRVCATGAVDGLECNARTAAMVTTDPPSAVCCGFAVMMALKGCVTPVAFGALAAKQVGRCETLHISNGGALAAPRGGEVQSRH